jgi:tetratricopeptide (TPR) repeat protein
MKQSKIDLNFASAADDCHSIQMKGVFKMKTVPFCASISIMILVALLWVGDGYGQFSQGTAAPVFSLLDVNGQIYDLSKAKNQQLTILYFFAVDSRPSQEGLLSLNELAKQHQGSGLTVWAVTLSPPEKVRQFAAQTGLSFPLLLDKGRASDLYQARTILPTVCTVGPGLKILDYFQGGGKTTEAMLTRVAERKLQRRQTKMARAISNAVIKKNPQNVKAQAVKGYAALKDRNLPEAEKVFKGMSGNSTSGEVLGKEGLSAVYYQKGEMAKALEMVKEVEQKAPERAYVHTMKGNILYAQGKRKEAEAEFRAGAQKGESEVYQDAVRYNQLGRFYADSGQHQKARELYDQAVNIDPYYIEGTTNKGITYEKEGRWDKALESYQHALSVEKNDTFAAVLAQKAQEILNAQRDTERKNRIDQLVKDLAARYRSQKDRGPKVEDTWTSSPMVLSFIDIKEKGIMPERDGASAVFTSELSSMLNGSGRVRVVERGLLDRLLEELNLGSSDLADPEIKLKLGRVLAARLIGTGSLLHMPQGALLSLRLIDSETTEIAEVLTRQMSGLGGFEKQIFQLNREILKTVIVKYPLRGYLVKVNGDDAILNLGSRQGVVMGTKFEALEEQEPLQYKGKKLGSAARSVGELEAIRVEPDLSYLRISKRDRPLKADDKVQEKMEATGL